MRTCHLVLLLCIPFVLACSGIFGSNPDATPAKAAKAKVVSKPPPADKKPDAIAPPGDDDGPPFPEIKKEKQADPLPPGSAFDENDAAATLLWLEKISQEHKESFRNQNGLVRERIEQKLRDSIATMNGKKVRWTSTVYKIGRPVQPSPSGQANDAEIGLITVVKKTDHQTLMLIPCQLAKQGVDDMAGLFRVPLQEWMYDLKIKDGVIVTGTIRHTSYNFFDNLDKYNVFLADIQLTPAK